MPRGDSGAKRAIKKSESADKARRARIVDAIITFDWHNYGLDEVDEADTEYADALADKIAAAIEPEETR